MDMKAWIFFGAMGVISVAIMIVSYVVIFSGSCLSSLPPSCDTSSKGRRQDGAVTILGMIFVHESSNPENFRICSIIDEKGFFHLKCPPHGATKIAIRREKTAGCTGCCEATLAEAP
jgi:hypothetical protein